MTDQELLQAIGQIVETAVETKLESKLEPIRQDIRELKDSVLSMDIRIKQLESIVNRLETRMDRLEFNMDRLESRIRQLERRVDQLGVRTGQLEDKVDGIRVYMDTEQKQTLNLLLEGQQALWDRFVPQEQFGPLEDRTEVLELTVKRHSQEIRELQFA